ncbi:MAG: hypothetical protein EZS28_011168 [Streblomastix strix]|uniref:non-specific serine/threonine protein kinase n=1 Tax=Streblomastix strix TaxID=222440 RepID=A0A5J4WG30_9EUKA|nr:MAG: hypothetical protein EZS28_011168 [Streblomastix strix]
MAEGEISINVGDIVNQHYKLIRQIATGERRVIFCALDTSMKQVAIKLEKSSEEQPAICIEAAILKILAGQNHIPQFFHYGSHKNYKYLAMELMGPNMIDLANYKRPYKFNLHSVLKFGIQAIETLQVVHNKGFVHRDIKPGNFLIGNTQQTSGTFYLTGFGLCKKITKQDNMVAQLTNESTFHGSLKYASLNAHNYVELGRNDDLMSLLYVLVEFHNGLLPWSDVEDIIQIISISYLYLNKQLKKMKLI